MAAGSTDRVEVAAWSPVRASMRSAIDAEVARARFDSDLKAASRADAANAAARTRDAADRARADAAEADARTKAAEQGTRAKIADTKSPASPSKAEASDFSRDARPSAAGGRASRPARAETGTPEPRQGRDDAGLKLGSRGPDAADATAEADTLPSDGTDGTAPEAGAEGEPATAASDGSAAIVPGLSPPVAPAIPPVPPSTASAAGAAIDAGTRPAGASTGTVVETASAAGASLRPDMAAPLSPGATGMAIDAGTRPAGASSGTVIGTGSAAGAAKAGVPADSVPGPAKADADGSADASEAPTIAAAPLDFLAALADAPLPTAVPDAPKPTLAASGTAGASLQPDAVASPSPAVPLGQVPMTIGLRSLSGSSQFEIRLDPAELGRIDVKLDIDKERGTVTTHMVVERIDTLAMLQRDAGNLQQALAQAGLDPSEGGINLSLRSDGGTGNGENAGRDDRASRGGTRPDRTDERVALEAAPLRTLRGLGGLDIRI